MLYTQQSTHNIANRVVCVFICNTHAARMLSHQVCVSVVCINIHKHTRAHTEPFLAAELLPLKRTHTSRAARASENPPSATTTCHATPRQSRELSRPANPTLIYCHSSAARDRVLCTTHICIMYTIYICVYILCVLYVCVLCIML